MRSSLPLISILSLASTIPNAYCQSTTDDPTQRAELAFSALQIWYNAGTGLWDTAGWWNGANVMTMVSNLAKYDSKNERLVDLAKRIFANTLEQAPAKNPQPGIENKENADDDVDADVDPNDSDEEDIDEELDDLKRRERRRREILKFKSNRRRNETFHVLKPSLTGYRKTIGEDDQPSTNYPEGWNRVEFFDILDLPINRLSSQEGDVEAQANPNPEDWLDGFYDDDLWWALGWIGAYDVTKDTKYLKLAEGIFQAVARVWPTRCGNGGIWWSWEKEYMNAIANELYISTAAHLANRAQDKSYYVKWAKAGLNWFVDSGMINERGTINDGLTDDCKNNNRTTWSYNQGVILGALVELSRADPSTTTYLPLAHRIAKAAIKELSDSNGVIHDKCGPYCGGDASQFKGIFARNLQLLHAAAPDDVYRDTIRKNADSIWKNDRDEGDRLSIDWAGPWVDPANATTHSSAMDALVAALTI